MFINIFARNYKSNNDDQENSQMNSNIYQTDSRISESNQRYSSFFSKLNRDSGQQSADSDYMNFTTTEKKTYIIDKLIKERYQRHSMTELEVE